MQKDYTGKIFGSLRVLYNAEPVGKHRRVMCKCVCGKTTIVYMHHLVSGATQSCGCLRVAVRKKASARRFKARVEKQSAKV